MDLLGSLRKIVGIVFSNGSDKTATVEPSNTSHNVTLKLPNYDVADTDYIVSRESEDQESSGSLKNKDFDDATVKFIATGDDTATARFDLTNVTAGEDLEIDVERLHNIESKIDLSDTPSPSDHLVYNGTDFTPTAFSGTGWSIADMSSVSDSDTLVEDTEYNTDGDTTYTGFTLPDSPVDGSRIRIIDTGQDWSSDSITLTCGGSDTIYDGTDTSLELDVEGATVEIVYYDTNWTVSVTY